MEYWTEADQAVPAEEVRGVPDNADIWRCWIAENSLKHITVYKDGNDFYITALGRCRREHLAGLSQEEAEAKVEKLRNQIHANATNQGQPA